ncbi:MAG: hypothetical protein FWC68_01580 [Oscillospiraceae bacterium]|nr:hypothetical protein [Oscillospiraceae bacterium]
MDKNETNGVVLEGTNTASDIMDKIQVIREKVHEISDMIRKKKEIFQKDLEEMQTYLEGASFRERVVVNRYSIHEVQKSALEIARLEFEEASLREEWYNMQNFYWEQSLIRRADKINAGEFSGRYSKNFIANSLEVISEEQERAAKTIPLVNLRAKIKRLDAAIDFYTKSGDKKQVRAYKKELERAQGELQQLEQVASEIKKGDSR